MSPWVSALGPGAGLLCGKERLFGGWDPTLTYNVAHHLTNFIVARIGGGAHVGVLRVCGNKDLPAKSGDSGGAVGHGGQSEASAECREELRVRESEAAGSWECLKRHGGAGTGHTGAVPVQSVRWRCCCPGV
jgi:hypothetical protein